MATKVNHLDRAKDYIAKGEDYYRKAAEEIQAAIDEDPTLSYREIGVEIGKSKDWVGDIVRWHTSGGDHLPMGGPDQDRAQTKSRARKAAREHPEVIAEAIAEAPPEAQRKIADEIVKRPTTEKSLRSVAEPRTRKTREPKPTEQKLSEAVFALWEVGEMLLDTVPAGEARVRMTALAEKAERLSGGILHLLGTGELEAEFADLVRQVGAES